MTDPAQQARAAVTALGIDVGPTTGMLYAAWDRVSCELLSCLAWECTGRMSAPMLVLLLESGYAPQAAGIEAFVARARSAKLRGVSGTAIQGQVAQLTGILARAGIPADTRAAGIVKPWATDKRLGAAGLLVPTEKFTDARDAARHALFTAVARCGMSDPLSMTAARAAATAGEN